MFNFFIEININNSFFNFYFIYCYIFSIGLRFGKEGNQLKIYMLYSKQILGVYFECIFELFFIKMYSNLILSNRGNMIGLSIYYRYSWKIISLLFSNLSKKINGDL